MLRERFKKKREYSLSNKSIDNKSQIKISSWSVNFNSSKIDAKIKVLKGKVIGFSLNLSYIKGDENDV